MKKTRSIILGTVLSVSLALSGCSSSQEEQEEEQYHTGTHTGVLYNHLGVPFLFHGGGVATPMHPTHPDYNSAVAEGKSIASGKTSPSGRVSVSRGGFGSSSGSHVAS
jgi:hypothetical protein